MSEIRQSFADSHTEPAVGDSRDPQDETQHPSTGTASTSTRPRFTFRRSTLRLGHTHRGFGQSKKSEAPEPQSTPVLLGEVSAPHQSNCKHQGPGKPAHSESDEQKRERPSTANSSPSAASAHSPDREQSSDTAQLPNSAEQSSGVGATEEPIVKVECFSPISEFTLPPPSIRVLPPAEKPGSLGTRAILSTSAKSSKMVFWGAASSKAPVPAVVGGDSGGPTDALLSGDLPARSLPGVDLPNTTVPPLPLGIPALPSVINDLDNGPNPPHAKKRMRRKLKQKAQPRLAKARQLVLKKKILSVILGKDLAAILEPHLNAATSQMKGPADNGAPITAPTPL